MQKLIRGLVNYVNNEIKDNNHKNTMSNKWSV